MSAEQGSAEWLFERLGHATASRFNDIIAKSAKGQPLAGRETYLWELVIERLTQQPSDHWTSSAMMWGSEQEQFARMTYEAQTGAMVEEVGFERHKSIALCGGSPDGLLGEDGMIEIKCPFNSTNHLLTILNGMPDEHQAQTQGLLWILNREYCDFISFDPRMPEHRRLYVQRINRADDFIAMLEAEVRVFLNDVQARL